MLILDPSELLEDFSLYLNSRLQKSRNQSLTQPEIEMTEVTKVAATQQRYRGLDNMTLSCLGLAFLEIGFWKPLSSLRRDYDADEIETAQRLVGSNSVLGNGFQRMTERCLRRDFGFGADLGAVELQSAVYNDIVCPLEEVIEKLEKFGI
jgi:hypothetical protein